MQKDYTRFSNNGVTLPPVPEGTPRQFRWNSIPPNMRVIVARFDRDGEPQN